MRVAIVPVSLINGVKTIEVRSARYMSASFFIGNEEEKALQRAVDGVKRAEQRVANALDRLARRDAERRALGIGF